MFYTVLFFIVFLLLGNASLSVGTLPFWGLLLAVLADVFLWSPLGRRWVVRV